MALVNLLRFDARSGAILSDEEHWNVFLRKRLQGDNIHSLLTPEMAEAWGMEVVYGAVGYPSFHREVVAGVRRVLAARLAGGPGAAAAPETVREVARVAFEEMQQAIRRRIDQKLRFFYGFDTQDLHRGSFSQDGRQVPIKTALVKEAAAKLAEGDEKDTLLKAAFASRAAVFGRDSKVGITAYHLAPEKWILGYNHEGFEAIGAGKYASGIVFGRDFLRKNFKQREAGYAPAEGLFELIQSAQLAADHFKEVGGNLNFALILGEGKTFADRYREVFDDTARLAGEIVRAAGGELVTRAQAITLLDRLVFRREPFDAIEAELFAQAGSPERLDLLLRRYKAQEIEELLGAAPPAAPAAPAAPARKKGGRR